MRAHLVRPVQTLLALSVSVGCVIAQEQDYWQFRLGLEPGVGSVQVNTPFGSTKEGVDNNSGLAMELGYRILDTQGKRSSTAIGIEAFLGLSSATGENFNREVTATNLYLGLELDFLYRVSHSVPVYVGLAPQFSLGYTQQTQTIGGFDYNGDGYMAGAGISLVGFYEWNKFLFGADLGYKGWLSHASYTNAEMDARVRGEGMSMGLSVGYDLESIIPSGTFSRGNAPESREFVQVRLGTTAPASNVNVTGPFSYSFEPDAKSGTALEIGYHSIDVRKKPGYALGVNGYIGGNRITAGSDTSITNLYVGLGVDLLYQITTETPIYIGVLPEVAIGLSSGKDTSSRSGYYYSYGLAAVSYVMLDHVLLGFDVGMQSWTSELSKADDGFDVSATGKGLRFGFTAGYDF